jgi:hypothetical protein
MAALLLLLAAGPRAPELPVLHELSALLLMLVGAAMLVLLVLQLELIATTLALLLHALAPALLYQRACRACASALDRQPLYRQDTNAQGVCHGLLCGAQNQSGDSALLACMATAGGHMHCYRQSNSNNYHKYSKIQRLVCLRLCDQPT